MVTPMLDKRLLDGDGASESGPCHCEGDEEAVARVIHLFATVLAEQPTKRAVVPVDEIEPCSVADRLDETCRAADVAEQEGRTNGVAGRGATKNDLTPHGFGPPGADRKGRVLRVGAAS